MATAQPTGRYGIAALNVYAGLAQIPVPTLFDGRGLDRERLENLAMRRRSVALPFEDPVTNAVNAATPLLNALSEEERASIELLVTSSESGVDYSKSISSYVHDQLELSNHCRLLEVKQACYAATAAFQLAVSYVASGVSPNAKALIIATDVALVDERAGYAEPATGHGAVALLVGEEPRVLAVDPGAFGTYSYETLDSARPSPRYDIADIDRSLFAYLDCLTGSFGEYASRVRGADFVDTFDYLAMHTPFSGIVRAAHRKMMRERGDSDSGGIAEDFERRAAPSLVYPAEVGNLCSGSVYLALASLLDNAAVTEPRRVGLYTYGSGCSSEFYSGVVTADSKEAVGDTRLGQRLAERVELSFEAYEQLWQHNRWCLEPTEDRSVDVDHWTGFLGSPLPELPLLVNTGTKGYHRQYEWIG
ncbi:polyketide biosynthesis 3-hydroxy-3-methylglutaryl-CoA synthase-like enzyme PksG [Actinopolyspora lacussalsi]|nr:polyketide biosynthesis 3-hydroxy-3-methylglutaryl-CoA synthase-like enzyme PksG [Actinopolyspora lacussalsi]